MLRWTSEYLTKSQEAEQFYPLQRWLASSSSQWLAWEDGFSPLGLIVHGAHNGSATQYISALLTYLHPGQVSSWSLGQSFYSCT